MCRNIVCKCVGNVSRCEGSMCILGVKRSEILNITYTTQSNQLLKSHIVYETVSLNVDMSSDMVVGVKVLCRMQYNQTARQSR